MTVLTDMPGDAPRNRQAYDGEADEVRAGEFFHGARLDPRRVAALFRVHAGLFVLVAGAVFLSASAYTLLAPRSFTSTAGLVVETPDRPGRNGEAQPAQPADPATVETDVQLVQSREIADQVVDALKLDRDPAFWAAAHRRAPPGQGSRQATAVGIVHDGLKARRAGLTSVIAIDFTSGDPEMAARIANSYADEVLIAQSRAKLIASRQAGSALNDRLEGLRKAALSDAASLAQFRAVHGLYSSAGTGLDEQEAAGFDQQLVQAQADDAGDQARLAAARSELAGAGEGAKAVALDSPVLQGLRAQRSQLSAQVAQLETRYGARYPDVVAAEQQLADIDAGIQAEVGRIVSELKTRAEVDHQRVARLQAALGSAHGRLAGGAEASVSLDELQRHADASRQVYEDYLARYQQASASQGAEQPDARISNRADPSPRPSSPDAPLDLALGLVAAVGAAAAAVFAREALRSGLATGEDVEQRLGLPCLGSIPALASVAARRDRRMSPADYLLARPQSAFGEAVRSLRTSLRFADGGQGARLLLLTSALSGEGKSTTALCLARSAARAGARVLLVDCDLRRRTVTTLLGSAPEVGLREVLNGTAQLEDALVRDEGSGAHVLPLADASGAPEELFETAAMGRLLRELSAAFDLVLLDTPPVLAVAATRVLAAKADAVVLLARWRRTPETAVVSALKLLDAAGARVAGVVLAQVDPLQQARYGHGDAAHLYAGRKAYYAA